MRYLNILILLLITTACSSLGAHQVAKERTQQRFLPNNFQSSNLKFKEVKPETGLWTGSISGTGLYSLNIKLFNRQGLVARKFMGKVELKAHESAQKFQFQSNLPEENFTRWIVVAKRLI